MTESNSTPREPAARPPITDRPWFWLLVYGGMAIVALAAIAPKHFKRQERLDRMSNARQEVWRNRVEGKLPAQADDMPSKKTSASGGEAESNDPADESLDPQKPHTRSFDTGPMLLIVAAAVWLAGSTAYFLLPRLSRRYYPRFTSNSPPPSQASS